MALQKPLENCQCAALIPFILSVCLWVSHCVQLGKKKMSKKNTSLRLFMPISVILCLKLVCFVYFNYLSLFWLISSWPQ